MKIQIHDTTLIRPSTPPFTKPHTLQLSYLDSDPNLNTSFRYVRVYAADHAGDVASRDPYAVISAALSSALVPYYPLMGSLRRASSGDRLELHCVDGGDLPLVQATADCSLSSVDYLNGAEPESVEGLAPNPDRDQMRANPCWLQVTKFRCGGFCLGAAINHMMCDGAGGTQFFAAVAELARGVGRVSVEPVWGREVMLRPQDPTRDEAGVGDYLCERGYLPYEDDDDRDVEVAREYFEVKEEWVEKLKAWMMEKCGVKFTTFEALGAFIWRAKVKVSDIPEDDQVKFAYSADIRNRLEPPLPTGYWGNGCVPVYAKRTARDLLREPIWSIAELIKKSKGNVCNKYARSYIDFQMMNQGERVLSAGKHVSGFTDWRHLRHSAVDFGWGGPVNVVPLSRTILGSTEACYFLPWCSPGSEENGRFRVLVNVKRSCLDKFKEELAKLSRLDFEPPVFRE